EGRRFRAAEITLRRVGFRLTSTLGMCARADHSGLMPANWITFAHFSVSSAISLPNSLEEIGFGTLPDAAKRDRKSGSATPPLLSALSLSTISADMPLGAPIPPTALAS